MGGGGTVTVAESYRSLEVLLEDQGTMAGKMLAVSLALHLCLLALVTGLRFSSAGERPLTSYQVSLVSMPQPVRSAPPPAEPPPLPATKPATTPPVRPSAPKVAPAITVSPLHKGMDIKRQPKTQMQDLLRTIELPPEAPKLGKLSPVSPLDRVEASRQDIAKLLDPLKVPEVQALPPPPIELSVASREVPPQVPSRHSSRQPTEQAATAPIVPPTTAIQVPGIVPGLNRYLALVQSKISSQWVAPQVDLTGRSLQVVIKFRLDRSGVVSHVAVEKSSGNEYYDMAGTRAVLSANPLPPFPQDMSDTTVDAHFSFTVGDQAG